jgi:lambda family phage portal protein
MDKPGVFERALVAVAPTWAATRARARREYHQHKAASDVLRKYEAAGDGRRNAGWKRPGTSARAEVGSSAAKLRNGARQLVRDNGNAANAVNVLETNVIGTGIRPEFETGSDRINRRIEELWEEHVDCESSGAEECGSFYTRQGLGFRAIVESGSVIYRRRRRRAGEYCLPYQVQILEPDFLDVTKTQASGKNTIINGKEYNARGEVVAYHLYLAHPGDNFFNLRRAFESTRVPAEQVSHAFRMDRPGQIDGVSWFSPVMTTLRDLADTRDAYQLRQKIAACYSVFIHDSANPTDQVGNGEDEVGQHIEPGRVESLPPGKTVSFANPPGVTGLSDFDRAQLLTIAAGLGIPYEALTGDLRNVNFLSGRMGWLSFYRNIDSWRAKIVIPRLCKPEVRWFLEGIALEHGINRPVRTQWTAPHRDLLNPGEEIKALREEMRLGALSYPDMVRMRGKDPEKVLESWKKWASKLDSEGLYFDWDPRHFSLPGNHNVNQSEEEINDSGTE